MSPTLESVLKDINHRSRARVFLASGPLCIALCVAGCGGSRTPPQGEANLLGPPLAAADGTTLPPYPKGGAQVLSIAGTAELSGSDPYQVALNCAAAVRTTARVLAKTALVTTDAQVASLQQADSLFAGRAAAAGAKMGHSPAEVDASLSARVQTAMEDPGTQVGVAATCLKQVSPEG